MSSPAPLPPSASEKERKSHQLIAPALERSHDNFIRERISLSSALPATPPRPRAALHRAALIGSISSPMKREMPSSNPFPASGIVRAAGTGLMHLIDDATVIGRLVFRRKTLIGSLGFVSVGRFAGVCGVLTDGWFEGGLTECFGGWWVLRCVLRAGLMFKGRLRGRVWLNSLEMFVFVGMCPMRIEFFG